MIHSVSVCDNFYPDPDAVRSRALGMSFNEPENYTGWRTASYFPRGIRARIERAFNLRIAEWPDDPSDIGAGNGVFFSAYARGARAEAVGVHFDSPPEWMMMIVYLTPDAPVDSGTSFWKHRRTGLAAGPTKADARRLGATVEELEQSLYRDSQRRSAWVEIDRVGNVYNRAVIFPGGRLHSASRHFGGDLDEGRIYQTFHFAAE